MFVPKESSKDFKQLWRFVSIYATNTVVDYTGINIGEIQSQFGVLGQKTMGLPTIFWLFLGYDNEFLIYGNSLGHS